MKLNTKNKKQKGKIYQKNKKWKNKYVFWDKKACENENPVYYISFTNQSEQNKYQ